MKRIDLYLAKTVIVNALLVLLVLTVLAAVITFVGEIHNLSSTYTVAEAARFTLLKIPGSMYDMFTIAALLGALLGLGELAGHNELTVMRVAGVSAARLGLSAMAGGLVLAVACVLLGELVVPTTEQIAEDRRAELVNARTNVLGVGGIWAKDGASFVNVRAMSNRNMARGVYVYDVTPDRQLAKVTFANSAVFAVQPPELHAMRGTLLSVDGSQVIHAQKKAWQTSLNPNIISLFALSASSLSAAGLYDYIGYLRANRLDEARYVAEFWDHVARPVALLLMLMLALPFVFGPLRSSSTGQRMLVGMLIGIGFYVFNTMFMQTGVVFGLDPFATAWLPTFLLGSISILAVRRIK
ncbi:MAG TPA: LPS export ABC transporter permease LptG [Gammaproteobacteria bacterium]|jgi:lipopolysaccharide export system permease protein